MRRSIMLTATLAALSAVPAAAQAPLQKVRITPVDGSSRPVDAAFPHQGMRVIGIVRPFVAGQTALVSYYKGARLLATRKARVNSIGHNSGRFIAQIPVGSRFGFSVTILATVAGFKAPVRTLPVVPNGVRPGWRGASVRYLQNLLTARHYSVPLSGVMDDATGRAVEAFRKVVGLPRTQDADGHIFALLARGAGRFRVRYPQHGRHFEADLSHQVLAEVLPGGRVRAIYMLSSGKPSTPTVVGTFHVYLQTPGVNAKGMVDSNYFIRGYAIHGYPDVPTYPASHGCLRVPIPNAASIFQWAKIGEIVDVYYRGGGGSHNLHGNAGP
jgi:hypothetical protein